MWRTVQLVTEMNPPLLFILLILKIEDDVSTGTTDDGAPPPSAEPTSGGAAAPADRRGPRGTRGGAGRPPERNAARDARVRAMQDRFLRVDHAGEIGADRIYAGQMAVLGTRSTQPIEARSKTLGRS